MNCNHEWAEIQIPQIGGAMCKHCNMDLRKGQWQYVQRLTAELAETRTRYKGIEEGNTMLGKELLELKHQLAEARAIIKSQSVPTAIVQLSGDAEYWKERAEKAEAEVERLKQVDCSTCAGRETNEIIADTRRQTASEIVELLADVIWKKEGSLFMAMDIVRGKYDV